MDNYKLRSLNIELTNHCNLQCVMCLRQEMTYPKGYMTADLYQGLIGEAAELDIAKVRFHWRGEPMLHPLWHWMIEEAKRVNIHNTVLFTNGVLLDDRARSAVLRSGLDEIQISLDGHSKEVFQKIRVGAKYSAVMENVNALLMDKDREGSSIKVVLRFVVLEWNKDELEEFCNQWGSLVDDIIITENTLSYLDKLQSDNDREDRPICHDLANELFVSWDGYVFPCFASWNGQLVLGNVHHTTLGEIWHGDAACSLRHLHVHHQHDDIPLCRSCHMDQCEFISLKSGKFRRF